MNLTPQDLYSLIEELRPYLYSQTKAEINQKIDTWYNTKEERLKSDLMYAKQLEIKKESHFYWFDYIMTQNDYNELNQTTSYDICTLQLQKSQIKYLGNSNESYSLTRNANKCFELIMKKLGIEKNENPFNGENNYFIFDARLKVKKCEHILKSTISSDIISKKVFYIDELINIWIKNKSCKNEGDIKLKTDISVWDCLKTEKLLLSLLPFYNKYHNLKEYEMYKDEVTLIKDKIYQYIKSVPAELKDQQIFDLLINHLSPKIFNNVHKNILLLNDERARELFMNKILDLALFSIEDVESYLKDFIIECSKVTGEKLEISQYEDILSKIIPLRINKRICF